MASEVCNSYKEVMLEIRNVEHKEDTRHEEYLKELAEYKVVEASQTGILKAIHKRLDTFHVDSKDLREALEEHMDDEMTHHTLIAEYMATTTELLKHVASKEDIVEVKGKIRTIWILGGLASTFIGMLLTFFIWYAEANIDNKISVSKTELIKERKD